MIIKIFVDYYMSGMTYTTFDEIHEFGNYQNLDKAFMHIGHKSLIIHKSRLKA